MYLCMCVLSCVQLFATPGTIAHQPPLSMGFPMQEYRSGLPFPSPGDLPWPRNQICVSCIAGGFFTTEPPGKSNLDCRLSFFFFLMDSKWQSEIGDWLSCCNLRAYSDRIYSVMQNQRWSFKQLEGLQLCWKQACMRLCNICFHAVQVRLDEWYYVFQ